MVSFISRTEGRFSVPTGGASVSATIANGAGAQTVTVAAGSYYLTAAGGVSGLLSTLQTQLNSTLQGYPTTATTTAAALGYGTWTSGYGWLINETSGNLSPAFGGVTLTATSLVYGAGPLGGIDGAISFDAGTDKADGGNIVDVTGTGDLIAILICRIDAAPASTKILLSKWAGGASGGWQIAVNSSGEYIFQGITTAGSVQFTSNAAAPLGSWCAVIATIERATGKARLAVRTLAGVTTLGVEQTIAATSLSGTGALRLGDRADNTGAATTGAYIAAAYAVSGSGIAAGLEANISTAITSFVNAVNASWSVALSPTTGQVSIGWSGYTTPTWSLSWTSTDLRDLLGHTANITNATTTQTGTYAARGCWIPDCPLNLEGDPRSAPIVTDRRDSEGPTGITLSLVGNVKYRHRGLVWSHCPASQIWESQATYTNGSYEKFCKDVFLGQGHAWFTPSSRVQVYWSNAGTATLLGSTFNSNAGVSGWFVKGVSSIEPRKASGDYAGLWRVEWSEVNCDG